MTFEACNLFVGERPCIRLAGHAGACAAKPADLVNVSRRVDKQTYLAYREKARDLCGAGDERLRNPEFSVEQHANVQVVERGAYVECHVFVPKELL